MSALATVERNEEGFLVNPADWNKEIAVEIAQDEGISELSEEHWKIIEFSRANAESSGAAPTLTPNYSRCRRAHKRTFQAIP